jgi:hypothetical protein
VSGTKEPKPKAVAEVMLNVLATVAVAATEKTGVVVWAQPTVQAPVAARATPMRARRCAARAEPRNCRTKAGRLTCCFFMLLPH